MRSTSPDAMPTPVSRTEISAFPDRTATLTATVPPASVNFTAFWSRFPSTCEMRGASASIHTGLAGRS
jgi:hypothetical protein